MEERGASNPAQDIVSLEVRVSGRVQGVGFRFFTHEAARRLSLVGYVANLRDGALRAYVEGPRATLEEFLRLMQRGPAGSAVRETRVSWGHATGQYSAFRIEHTL